ncbi:PAS domain-containing sensor histidine kinase [Qipengyuania spongiae]|uniref:histidine kinase n=1 Tax=Qipengyuania spongiae TaxID=2909673 RepID=A0ABY5SZA0_9SPHN|nr:PAS domain-containing sensor histidine kinase [Qipengyuania spongiae]UVI39584.1 PAS domain S-box protein [Qipengyuania spongiae]
MNFAAERNTRKLLASSEAQLRSILATSPSAMVVIDEWGVICAFSAAAETMFGFRANEVLGRNVNVLMPQPNSTSHDGYIRNYLTSGEPQIIGIGRRVHGRRKDGATFALHLEIGESNAGGRRLFTAFMHDLSAEETSEAELRQLQSELMRQSRVGILTTMATALAHEINQPLAAICNYLEAAQAMMEASPPHYDSTSIRNALRDATKEAGRAGQIVSRLRRFIARGDLQRSLTMPSDLLEQSCALASMEAKERGLRCVVRVSPSEEPILVDPVQIQQVLINLARNAIEAMSESNAPQKIVFSVSVTDGFVRFGVQDSGPGLPPDHKLFIPFNSTKHDGMGLGLSICKTIVEAHGGEIWHEPVEPHGSIFRFTIPVARRDHDDDRH